MKGKENAAFVAAMEDILDVYEMPYNPQVPVICMDEKLYQKLGDARAPLPMRPGSNLKTDFEYIRKGTSSIFVFTELLAGWRHVSARERHTALDWAEEMKYLLDECYPDKERIIVVMDNLNVHAEASLYKRYEAPEARRLAKRLEIPKYLMFKGEPFAEEDYCEAIKAVQAAIEKYDPAIIAAKWDNTNPRIQLEPIGTRGYIELLPIQ